MKPRTLLAIVESTYDTDGTPVAANAIDVMNMSTDRYSGPTVTRDVERHTEGNQTQINTSPKSVMSFDVEAAGSGALGVSPHVGPLLLGCGLDEVIDAGVSVTYTVAVDSGDSLTLYDYDEETGLYQKSTGARGQLSFSMSKGQVPVWKFGGFIGTYYSPTADVPPGGIDWSTLVDPLAVTKDNTPIFTLGGFAAPVESFEVNWGNEVTPVDVPNLRDVRITNRKGTLTMTVVAPDIGTKNFYADLESHAGSITLLPFHLQHGVDDGDITDISNQELQLISISEGTSDGNRTYTINANLIDNPVVVFK